MQKVRGDSTCEADREVPRRRERTRHSGFAAAGWSSPFAWKASPLKRRRLYGLAPGFVALLRFECTASTARHQILTPDETGYQEGTRPSDSLRDLAQHQSGTLDSGRSGRRYADASALRFAGRAEQEDDNPGRGTPPKFAAARFPPTDEDRRIHHTSLDCQLVTATFSTEPSLEKWTCEVNNVLRNIFLSAMLGRTLTPAPR